MNDEPHWDFYVVPPNEDHKELLELFQDLYPDCNFYPATGLFTPIEGDDLLEPQKRFAIVKEKLE